MITCIWIRQSVCNQGAALEGTNDQKGFITEIEKVSIVRGEIS